MAKSKIQELIEIQTIRYKHKGPFNTIIAVLLLLCILKSAEKVCQVIWPQHIQDKQWFVMGISFCIHFICQFAYFLLYLPGYMDLIPGYESHRINKNTSWHWQNKQKWPNMAKRLAFYVAINYLVCYPIMIFLSVKISGIKVRFHDLPTMGELAWQLLFVAFVEDAGFYWFHRISHRYQWLYKYHKVHHQYTNVFSLATECTHPVDYVLGILVPSALPFIILGSRVHCFMFFFWQVWKIFISTEGHSGYEFSWSPTRVFPFVSDPSFHDYHHSKNMGNFCGSIYLWDFFNGSSDNYFAEYRDRMEKELKLRSDYKKL